MTRFRAALLTGLTGAAVLLGLVAARPARFDGRAAPPRVAVNPDRILADGYDSSTLTIGASGAPRVSIAEPARGARIEDLAKVGGVWRARIRAGVEPGMVRVRVDIPGAPPATAGLTLQLNAADSFEDGTPDFLRLDDDADRRSFRRWFTYLAEARYFQSAQERPAEIDDCAALIRYAYREALRAHDGAWASAAGLPVVPAFESVLKYQYPHTALGAALFRVRSGPFHAGDPSDGAFAEFADVRTLWRWNTHRLGRNLASARPGDLLFFRRDRDAYHSMIYLGESQFRPDGRRYVVYHTGPDGADPGEIRRLSLEELERFPRPEWRPVPANPVFLGVFRWNILRRESE